MHYLWTILLNDTDEDVIVIIDILYYAATHDMTSTVTVCWYVLAKVIRADESCIYLLFTLLIRIQLENNWYLFEISTGK